VSEAENSPQAPVAVKASPSGAAAGPVSGSVAVVVPTQPSEMVDVTLTQEKVPLASKNVEPSPFDDN